MSQKREKLVYAITHNVQYLSKLHKTREDEMRKTRITLTKMTTHNKELIGENDRLRSKCGELEKNEKELHDATSRINDMMIESQANAETIA